MLSFMTQEEYEQKLASSIKKSRIILEWTQKELANRANIPFSTFKRIEQKGKGSISDLIKIFICFNKMDEFLAIFKEEYSPLNEINTRQRIKS